MDAMLERFMAKVTWNGDEDECWIWESTRNSWGYGSFYSSVTKKQARAHRVAYELFVGPIPVGLQLDHLCRTRACVNPSHLEPVTNRENTLRGVGPTVELAARTHCKLGHPLSGPNLVIRKDGKGRECRACKKAYEYRRPWRSQAKVKPEGKR